jgi:hypothetical protein
MHTEEEIREDMDKLHALIDSLKVKYGPEFACVLAAGAGINTEITNEDDPDAFAGGAYMVGDPAMFHQACHCLLKSCKFIDGIIDAMECVIMHEHRKSGKPEFLDMMMVTSLESLKKILIMSTDEFKERLDAKNIEEAVENLLRDAGFKN